MRKSSSTPQEKIVLSLPSTENSNAPFSENSSPVFSENLVDVVEVTPLTSTVVCETMNSPDESLVVENASKE